jgi:hypothetical protein
MQKRISFIIGSLLGFILLILVGASFILLSEAKKADYSDDSEAQAVEMQENGAN